MNVIFASAEISPFAKTGGLGDVCGALPRELARLGHEVTVFMPYYRAARDWLERNGVVPEVVAEKVLGWASWSAPVKLLRAKIPGTAIPVIFVANDLLFDRDEIYDSKPDGADDNLERYTFFCRAVIAGCELLEISVDILHAHDWHAALLPVYLESGLRQTKTFEKASSVFTIHNLNYQGRYAASRFMALGLHSSYWSSTAVEYFGDLNLMKGAIIFANQVTTVSPTYAREIQSPAFGAGLDGLLRDHAYKLTGILNGIDVKQWNPENDPALAAHFSIDSIAEKEGCRRELRKETKLEFRAKTLIIGIVSRLVSQKGFELFLPIVPRLMALGVQVVALGTGEPHYEEAFARWGATYPKDFRSLMTFDDGLAHRITAGSDLFVMPSHYEPCGLNQMYALRYGTIPVVRETGGLADTVVAYDGANIEEANGFNFQNPTPEELLRTIWIATLYYRDVKTWRKLQRNGMSADFSWAASAREYDKVYKRAVG